MPAGRKPAAPKPKPATGPAPKREPAPEPRPAPKREPTSAPKPEPKPKPAATPKPPSRPASPKVAAHPPARTPAAHAPAHAPTPVRSTGRPAGRPSPPVSRRPAPSARARPAPRPAPHTQARPRTRPPAAHDRKTPAPRRARVSSDDPKVIMYQTASGRRVSQTVMRCLFLIGRAENDWNVDTCNSSGHCGVFQLDRDWQRMHNYRDVAFWTNYAIDHGFYSYGGLNHIAATHPTWSIGAMVQACQGAGPTFSAAAAYYNGRLSQSDADLRSVQGSAPKGFLPTPYSGNAEPWPGNYMDADVVFRQGLGNGAHHSNSAWFYARGLTFVPGAVT